MDQVTDTTKPALPRTMAEVDASAVKIAKGAFGLSEAELSAAEGNGAGVAPVKADAADIIARLGLKVKAEAEKVVEKVQHNFQVTSEIRSGLVALPPSELDAPRPVPNAVIEDAIDGQPPSDPNTVFEDGEFKVTSRDGLMELIAKESQPVKEYVAPPRTARQQSQLEAEQAAGRARVQAHAEQLASRPPVVISEEERRAQGSNNPVYRPADFREYQPMTAPANSKG